MAINLQISRHVRRYDARVLLSFIVDMFSLFYDSLVKDEGLGSLKPHGGRHRAGPPQLISLRAGVSQPFCSPVVS